ncbi:MAG TPA: hypothetical protein VF271_02285 [Rhodanobacteraceae bacterium]
MNPLDEQSPAAGPGFEKAQTIGGGLQRKVTTRPIPGVTAADETDQCRLLKLLPHGRDPMSTRRFRRYLAKLERKKRKAVRR